MSVEQIKRDVETAISRHGWAVIAVAPDQERLVPGFSYTIGFQETLGHPETVVFGLPENASRAILNDLGELIRRDGPPPAGERLARFAQGLDLALVEVPEEPGARWLRLAAGRAGSRGRPFEAAQLVWPDADNRFPWQEGHDPLLRHAQPLLYGAGGNA